MTEIKEKEKEVMRWWNSKANDKIELVKDEYSTYDFEGENVIVEVKHRFKSYQSKMIESMKLSNNYQQSQLKKKEFIYIVVDENGISIFNISKVINKIIKLPEYNKLMEHTHYWSENKPKIMKLHRNLPRNLSIMWEQKF
jgi:type IV secretory pathway TraG/TraD family ATPase VirD4|tara:strand:+ start:3525 stop:3944 length:420 start_codon:yes stop_codon:yes gene_type:complete